jgi:hypothetical protein
VSRNRPDRATADPEEIAPMKDKRNRFCLGVALLVVWGASGPAEAGIWKRIIVGLDEAGFDVQGDRNFLSGGADIIVARQFNGEVLDFGASEITLTGTPVLQFSTGGRGLQVLDFSLNTNNTPFNYTWTTDTGNQITTIDGSYFANITGSLNSFGYYDLSIDVSSRQTVTQDGRISDSVDELDFDVGPIDLRGNLFADLLAVVSEPIFNVLGIDNIFAEFSGSAKLGEALSARAREVQEKARMGAELTPEEIGQLASISSMAAALGIQVPAMPAISDSMYQDIVAAADAMILPQRFEGQALPEPSTLGLLLLAIPALRRRR